MMLPDETTPPYDPATGTPGYVPGEVKWVEGDHPTDNPDGVTNSNHDYTPKTQEEKAQLLGVQMSEVVEVDPDLPYPDGDQHPMHERDAMLARVHSPMELVEAENMGKQQEANLAAGGSVEGSNPGLSSADLQRDEGSPGTQPGGGPV